VLSGIAKINLLRDIPWPIGAIQRVIKSPVFAVKENALATYNFFRNCLNVRLLTQQAQLLIRLQLWLSGARICR
jgi:hypothetical protein